MSKVFSWKIDDKEYAYLFIPNKKEHLSSRIIDADIIDKMIDKISSWDEKKYKTAFSQMNEEINNKYGFEIPYDSMYFNGNSDKKNIVLLGSSKEKEKKIENIKEELLIEIDKRFKIILDEFNSLYNELLNKSNKQMLDTIKLTKETQDNTLLKLKNITDESLNKFERASNRLEKASKILELDDNNINVDTLKIIYKDINKTNKWIDGVSGDVKTFITEFKDFENKLTQEEKKNGVLYSLKNKIDKTVSNIDTMKTSIKNIETEQIKQKNNEILLGTNLNDKYNINKGDFFIKVDEEKITIENQKTQNIIVIDDDGIKLNGNIYINGNKF